MDDTVTEAIPHQERRPAPLIDATRCNGCGFCVRACPNNVLEINNGVASVARPESCDYVGLCETVCPVEAIQRLFQIVVLDQQGDHP